MCIRNIVSLSNYYIYCIVSSGGCCMSEKPRCETHLLRPADLVQAAAAARRTTVSLSTKHARAIRTRHLFPYRERWRRFGSGDRPILERRGGGPRGTRDPATDSDSDSDPDADSDPDSDADSDPDSDSGPTLRLWRRSGIVRDLHGG